MKLRIHAYSSDEKLPPHADVRANCGHVVRDAVVAFEWLTQAMGVQPEYPRDNTCPKCLETTTRTKENEGWTYLYGIVESSVWRQYLDKIAEMSA